MKKEMYLKMSSDGGGLILVMNVLELRREMDFTMFSIKASTIFDTMTVYNRVNN